MTNSGLRQRIEKYVLQNAIFYSGKADPKAVLGKVLGNEPELRAQVPQVRKELDSLVREINAMPLGKQEAMLSNIAPDLLVKEEKKQDDLSPLPNAVPGKVVTRFAPSPTGSLNIAHLLRAAMMSYLYAQKYNGRFILRFEDTDPVKIGKPYYQDIQDDLESAGIKWDRLVIESDYMELYYSLAERLLEEGHAYMCTCPADRFRALKLKKRNCPCRDNSPQENLSLFHKAVAGRYPEGAIAMRFRTSMSDPNPALRDPPLMRVSKSRHPLKARKFSLWPLYNFANVVMDHDQGVTHVFRGKEHQHNTDLQRRVYEAFGWNPPTTVNFGMLYLPGDKVHTRDIREMIKSGKVSGWDDPRLHTVRALVRRGFQPGAFRLFSINVGLTKHDVRLSWDTLESFNRSLIDITANRYMVVTDPVRVSLKGGPEVSRVTADLHPDDPKRGRKQVPVSRSAFYISKDDWKRFQGKDIRLKNLFNVKLLHRTATFTGDEVIQSMPKIQWVSGPAVEISLLKPDSSARCLGEPAMRGLRKGEIIQMERLGYGRVEKKGRVLTIIWTHK